MESPHASGKIASMFVANATIDGCGERQMDAIAREYDTRRAADGASIVAELRPMEDGDVVAAFVNGEEQAFQEIVARYQTRLINFVYREISDREKAEDLVQDVFLRVYRHLHNFDRTKKFSTWIYTIAANLAKNELRNRSRYRLVLLDRMKTIWRGEERPLELEDTSSRPDDLFHKRHLCALVEEAATKLSGNHRAVFVLRDVEGKSYEEIAEITGARVGTVKSRLSRARESVAAFIDPWVD
jgi:RNA polymerase sigma-70 factor, ECF subfamily